MLVCRVARNPAATRERLLNAAEELVLDHGFAGTTVEAVIERAEVTKGAFFHHFKSKAELGKALIDRYAMLDHTLLESTMERAERLTRDPLQQMLIFVGLLEEKMGELTDPYPGCLFASFCYQAELFDEETLAVGERAMLLWRKRLGDKLRKASQDCPGIANENHESLADMMTVILEGAFIVSRTLHEPALIAGQLAHYRNYIELLANQPRR